MTTAPLPETVRHLPLDAELTGLAELVGDARVVAIGENSHYIREFTELRTRILDLLVTELGFDVLAFESGFAEGHLVDDWVRGGPGDVETVARNGFTFRFGDFPEMHTMLHRLRAHHAAGHRVRFTGLDVPGSGGSPLPALHRVRAHLAAHHPGHLPFADAAIEATAPYDSPNNGAAPARYAALDTAVRDAATTALARLLLRLDALHPGPDPLAHTVARHHALGALRLDEQLRELHHLGTLAPPPPGEPPLTLPSSRDLYMAETVRLLRAPHTTGGTGLTGDGTGARVVLMLHNAHAQRVPMQLLPHAPMTSTGSHLAADLGPDYLAIGLTARTGTTTDAALDPQAPHGIAVRPVPLGPPPPDSIEHTLPADHPALLDLRAARGTPTPTTIRHTHLNVPTNLSDAYDLLAHLPTMSPGLAEEA